MTLPELPTDWLHPLLGKLLGLWRGQSRGIDLVDVNGDHPNVPIINAVDPLLMSYDEAESRLDLAIDPLALIPSVPTANTAYVDATNGSDVGPTAGQVGERTLPFLTVKAALDAVLLLGPAPVTNPFLIQIKPGALTEVPLSIASGVTVASSDGPGTVTVVASTTTAALFTLLADSALSGITVAGASGAGGVGISTSAAATVHRCAIVDCETLVRAKSGAELALAHCNGVGDSSVLAGFEAVNSGQLVAHSCNVTGQSGSLLGGPAFRSDGLGSELVVAAGCSAVYADEGVTASTNGKATVAGFAARSCGIGVRIPATGGTIEIGASEISDSAADDISVEAASGRLIAAGVLHDKPASIVAGADVYGMLLDRVNERSEQLGTFCVGSLDRPAASGAGQGCATVDGMVAQHWDGVTWTDVTDELRSSSGSVVDVVPGLGLGNHLYIGSDVPIFGLLLDIALAQTGGTITPEYWAGGWTAFDWMTSLAEAPYTPSGNALLAATGRQNMRFGAMPGWVQSVENAITKYWIRLRVSSVLTFPAPQLESLRLHGSYTRLDEDGVEEMFGDARPTVEVDLDMSTWKAGVGTAPTTANVLYGANTTVGSVADYTVGPGDRELGRRINLPPGLDTSWPVELAVEWYPTNTNTGALQMTLYHALVPAGAILNGGLTEGTIAATPTPPGVIGEIGTIDYSMLWPAGIAGVDGLAMTLRRIGGDPFTGDAIVTRATLRYRAWRL
jgi:hypothetical protein